MSIKASAIFSISNQIVCKLLGFILVIFLARFLSPEELGVYAIAASFAFLAVQFRSMGTNTYLVREDSLTEHTMRACLGICITISWVIGGVVILSSKFISEFYEMPELFYLLIILSSMFFISPFTVIPIACLEKEFKFKELAAYSITIQLFISATTIVLVLLEFSIFSIAIGVALGEVVGLLIVVLFFSQNLLWRPTFRNVGSIFRVSGTISLTNLFSKLSFLAPDFIIGKLGSPNDVAYFSRAQGLMDFIKSTLMSGVYPLITPYLSNNQANIQELSIAYMRATQVQLSILIPALAVSIVMAEPLIVLLFGEQWLPATELVHGIGIGVIFRALTGNAFALFVVSRKEKFWLLNEFLALLITVAAILIFFEHGLYFVSLLYALTGLFSFVVSSLLIKAKIGIGLVNQLRNIFPVFMLTIVVVIFSGATLAFSNIENSFLLVSISGVSVFFIWLICTSFLKLEIYDLLMNIVKFRFLSYSKRQ